MDDLKILIQQIIEKSSLPLQLNYDQLPAIVACADFLGYPIDVNIFVTFMCKCVPPIPWKVLEQWSTNYSTTQYKVLIEAINLFVINQQELSEKDQKELLLEAVDKQIWPFQTWPFKNWFVSDKIFLEVFCAEMDKADTLVKFKVPSTASTNKKHFLWQLLRRNDLIHLWSYHDITDRIVQFVSNGTGTDLNRNLRMNILKSLIEWRFKKILVILVFLKATKMLTDILNYISKKLI